jgi:UDP-2,3-diacylglucosamine pyrophosphatase LpxH
MAKQTALIEQIDSGQDVYGLILGDVLDYKLTESISDPESDTKIVDQIRRFQQQLGGRGERLIYLKGNHELAATDIYAM